MKAHIVCARLVYIQTSSPVQNLSVTGFTQNQPAGAKGTRAALTSTPEKKHIYSICTLSSLDLSEAHLMEMKRPRKKMRAFFT